MRDYPNIDQLVLASASPRRAELLASLGLEFEIRIPDIDETPRAGERPQAFAERLAREKAAAIEIDAETVLIAADTIVTRAGAILGKPVDEADAVNMLTSLAGGAHEVITGVCARRGASVHVFSVSTEVVFRALTETEIRAYVAGGDPMDKAGAYAIQGGAAHMVKAIRGSYTNVVGLPLSELHEILVSF